MLIQIAGLLDETALQELNSLLQTEAQAFVSGKGTAGWFAKSVKENEQLQGPVAERITGQVGDLLMRHSVFLAAARPKSFVKLLVSRYRPGMRYGRHVDDALMGGVRTDLSFTLFLSGPADYDGGELVLEGLDGETSLKPEAGSLVLYQTTSLHRVEEVTRGERLAIVGWVRSFIRSAEQRELLFELDQTIASLRELHADRQILDRIFKVRNNLTRMWAED
jgi:PKHD-type hydroxylase